MIGAILEMAEARLEVLNRRTRETVPASELVVGLQCGGSDAFSASPPIPARLCRRPAGAGGATVMFSEVTRCATPSIC